MKQLFFLFFPGFLFCNPVGAPVSPVAVFSESYFFRKYPVTVRMGYVGNFTFDRCLNQSSNKKERVDNYEIYSQSGHVIIDLFDRLGFFWELGSGKMETEFCTSFSNISHRLVLRTEDEFCWRVGSSFLFIDADTFFLGSGFSYSTFSPKLFFFEVDGMSFSAERKEVFYEEWQANLGISCVIDFFLPYIGVKYTSASSTFSLPSSFLRADNPDADINFRSRQNFGMYLGCTVKTDRFFQLTIEARLLDEEAASVFATFRL